MWFPSLVGGNSKITGQYSFDPGNREMLDWRG
jgi:hypothetical protein